VWHDMRQLRFCNPGQIKLRDLSKSKPHEA
jgi:hypothetical protein